MKKLFANGLVVLISCAVSFVLGELAVRAYLYMKDSSRSFDLVITTYQKVPLSKGTRYEFDPENNLEFKANVRYNNQGYRSDFDWHEDKELGEFRIAVFGDSYTECEPSDYSWVDVLHRKLSTNPELLERLGRKRITVANFGLSGAGFQRFGLEYLAVRKEYKPDLTVFAFIDEDFERLVTPTGSLRQAVRPHSGAIDKRLDTRNYLQIPGFGGNLYAVQRWPRSLGQNLPVS